MPTQDEIDAALKLLAGEGYGVTEPPPEPGPNDILDQIRAIAGCGVHCQDGKTVYMWLESDGDIREGTPTLVPGSVTVVPSASVVSGKTWHEAAIALLTRVRGG